MQDKERRKFKREMKDKLRTYDSNSLGVNSENQLNTGLNESSSGSDDEHTQDKPFALVR